MEDLRAFLPHVVRARSLPKTRSLGFDLEGQTQHDHRRTAQPALQVEPPQPRQRRGAPDAFTRIQIQPPNLSWRLPGRSPVTCERSTWGIG